MAMIDVFDIKKKVRAALFADAAVQAVFGASPNTRIFTRTPRTATFPWCRVEEISSTPVTGTMKGPGIEWVRRVILQFTTFDNYTGEDRVAAAQKAIADEMDAAPTNITLTSGTIFNSVAGACFSQWLAEHGTWMAVNVHELWISSV